VTTARSSKWKLGLLDIAAVGVVVVAILLPTPSKKVETLYVGEWAAHQGEVVAAQADLAARPNDREALARLAQALVDTGQSDWALRVAGAAAAAPAPDQWKALLVVSTVHADRLDVKEAHEWAVKSLAACDAPGAVCPDHERVRIDLYEKALEAGLDSGNDPRQDPDGFARAVNAATPMIRVGGHKRGQQPPK
jgi:hypothetical protein